MPVDLEGDARIIERHEWQTDQHLPAQQEPRDQAIERFVVKAIPPELDPPVDVFDVDGRLIDETTDEKISRWAQAIYDLHVNGHRLPDIAYNALIAGDGTVLVGRPTDVVPGQSAGVRSAEYVVGVRVPSTPEARNALAGVRFLVGLETAPGRIVDVVDTDDPELQAFVLAPAGIAYDEDDVVELNEQLEQDRLDAEKAAEDAAKAEAEAAKKAKSKPSPKKAKS